MDVAIGIGIGLVLGIFFGFLICSMATISARKEANQEHIRRFKEGNNNER